jgi:alpha-galactosidase
MSFYLMGLDNGGTLGRDEWMVWQYDRPERGEGIVQAFRQDSWEIFTKTFYLRGLNPVSQYEVTNLDLTGSVKVSGKDIMQTGLVVEI